MLEELLFDETPSEISELTEKKIKARSELFGRELTAEERKQVEKRARAGDEWQSNKYYLKGEKNGNLFSDKG